MKTIRFVLVLSLVALIGQAGALAAGPSGPNNIRIQLGYMVASGDQTEIIDRFDYYSSFETKAKFSGGAGIAFAYEYKLSDLVGLEASIGYFQTKLRAQVWEQAVTKQIGHLVFDNEKTVHTLPIALGVNFHLTNNGRVDFFLGPRLSYLSYGSYSAAINSNNKNGTGNLDLDLKKEFMLGLTLGLDVPMSSGWGWAFRLDYTPAQVKIDKCNQSVSAPPPIGKSVVDDTQIFLFTGNKLKPNPITLTIGASYKF